MCYLDSKGGRNSRCGDLYGGICNNPGINRKSDVEIIYVNDYMRACGF